MNVYSEGVFNIYKFILKPQHLFTWKIDENIIGAPNVRNNYSVIQLLLFSNIATAILIFSLLLLVH